MGGSLSATTGPESQFGDAFFCDDIEPGFEMDDDFTHVDAAAGYGDVSPFSDSPFGDFSMDALQGIPTAAYEEFIPTSSSSPVIPTAAAAGQMRLPYSLQLMPQQQQQQQAALGAQQTRQMQILQQQQQQIQWGRAAMEEQMRALMWGGVYAGPGMRGMGALGWDGTIRPNLLECGFGAGGVIDNERGREAGI